MSRVLFQDGFIGVTITNPENKMAAFYEKLGFIVSH